MKRHLSIFIVLVSIALGLNSCLTGEAQSTPELYSSLLYRLNASGGQDTLQYSDSVFVGDTLVLPTIIYGKFNPLISFETKADVELFDYWLKCDSANLTAIKDTSELKNGIIHIRQDTSIFNANIDVWFVPKKEGKHTIFFSVANAAGEQFSPRTFYYERTVSKAEDSGKEENPEEESGNNTDDEPDDEPTVDNQ